MDKKKVLVCGAGSVGIYTGVKLYSQGHDVKLFGRRKLRGIDKEVIIENKKYKVPEKIFNNIKGKEYDFVFITTKLYDFAKMIELIKKNKIKSKVFVAIQNGLFDTSEFSKILKKRIITVTVFSGFNLKGDTIYVNPTPMGWKTESSSNGKKTSELFLEAGIPCHTARNLNSLRAEKTIVNCCLNALSAIENKPFCSLFENKKTRERIENIFDESYNVLKKKFNLDNPQLMKKRMFKNWKNLKHYSSTHQDIISGRKNEVEFFNGYIVKLGEKYKLPIEHNIKIIQDVKKIA